MTILLFAVGKNKAAYTATPIAGDWAGVATSMKYLYLPSNSSKCKKKQCDRTDRQTDRPIDTVTYRSRCLRQKEVKRKDNLVYH